MREGFNLAAADKDFSEVSGCLSRASSSFTQQTQVMIRSIPRWALDGPLSDNLPFSGVFAMIARGYTRRITGFADIEPHLAFAHKTPRPGRRATIAASLFASYLIRYLKGLGHPADSPDIATLVGPDRAEQDKGS